MTSKTRAQEFKEKVERALAGGGPEKVKMQKERGKLLARERIDYLLDPGSFQELGLLVKTDAAEFGLKDKELPGDGVVTGLGRIHGRPVAVYAQDFTVLGGTLGLAQAHKIARLMDVALESRMPIIGLADSGGARIQEGVNSLGGYGEVFYRNVQASGLVPQISAILGPCAGGAVYSPGLTDFIFMVEGISHMFITGPEVVRQATGEITDFDSLGGAHVHGERSGVCHFIASSEEDCFRTIRELIGYLPAHSGEPPPEAASKDDPRRPSAKLEELAGQDPRKPFDVRTAIREIADEGSFLEVARSFAANLVVGFGRLNGHAVGFVANNSSHLAGSLDISASHKGARFVRFCDAFNIPVVTLVDVPGYWPGLTEEHGGIIVHGSKLLFAYCESTVPKVTVILRKAYGGAYDVMGSKHLGADVNFAWPNAEIAVMGPEGAAQILYSREIANAPDPESYLSEKIAAYRSHFANPWIAAQKGYLDEVIEPAHTREKIIGALEFLLTGNPRRSMLPRKHTNVPL
ncbi:MAG: acyl-CoA carboxylase subunit beta [Elusimicrobia bacterium]|nr:acyl-CoA carboxylase subunit beta [Elusimicrobiota bacterium]